MKIANWDYRERFGQGWAGLGRFASYLGRVGRVRLVEKWPDFRFGFLPPREFAIVVSLFEAELAGQLLVAGLVRVQVEPVQYGQRFLRVSMLSNQTKRERNKSNTIQIQNSFDDPPPTRKRVIIPRWPNKEEWTRNRLKDTGPISPKTRGRTELRAAKCVEEPRHTQVERWRAKWGRWRERGERKHNNNESRETLEYIKRIPRWPLLSQSSCSWWRRAPRQQDCELI